MKVYTSVPLLLGILALGGCQTTGSTRWMRYAPGPDLEYSKAECAIGAARGVENVVMFKRGVYARALQHLAPLARGIVGAGAIPPPNHEIRGFAGRPRRRQPGRGTAARGTREPASGRDPR